MSSYYKTQKGLAYIPKSKRYESRRSSGEVAASREQRSVCVRDGVLREVEVSFARSWRFGVERRIRFRVDCRVEW
jgi:hypothetical protein